MYIITYTSFAVICIIGDYEFFSSKKFIFKSTDGIGTVKQFGTADAWLPCNDKLCRLEDDAWGGHFAMRDITNDFTAVFAQRLHSDNNIEQVVTIRGECSEI